MFLQFARTINDILLDNFNIKHRRATTQVVPVRNISFYQKFYQLRASGDIYYVENVLSFHLLKFCEVFGMIPD